MRLQGLKWPLKESIRKTTRNYSQCLQKETKQILPRGHHAEVLTDMVLKNTDPHIHTHTHARTHTHTYTHTNTHTHCFRCDWTCFSDLFIRIALYNHNVFSNLVLIFLLISHIDHELATLSSSCSYNYDILIKQCNVTE